MLRRLAAIAAALFLLPEMVSGASPDVGQHLHLAVLNMPADGHPIARAPYTFHLDIKLHDFAARTRFLRLDDSSTTRAQIPLVLGPAPVTLDYPFDWTVDFSGWSVGRHELRWHLDSQDSDIGTAGTQRQFTTSRVQVCIESCSPNRGGRSTPFLGGGSWYTGITYVVPILDSPLSALVPGGNFTAHSQYSRSTQLCAFLNPDFHHGSHGISLGCFGSGTTKHSFAIPASAVGGDDIVIVSMTAQQAGVLHLKVGAGGDTFYFETQSWWRVSGLSLP